MKRRGVTASALLLLAALGVTGWAAGQSAPRSSPVTAVHLSQIAALFSSHGIKGGTATLDRYGRVELAGSFDDEGRVDHAFSLAQTVVGVRWVSPLTPENIKVKAWEDCLSRIFSGEACGPRIASVPSGSAGRTAADAGAAETPPGSISNKYALVVGVGKFRSRISPLSYANKDAYDVYGYLLDPNGGNFKQEHVILLRDEFATRNNVVRALEEIKLRAQPDDLVLVYLSSHGTPPDKYGGVHVVTYDAEVTPRERIWHTSLSEDILRDFIQTQRAKRLVVIMDACYSNGAYTQLTGFLPQGGKSLETGADEGYGRSRQHMATRLLGAKDLVLEESPPRRGAVPDAGKSWGRILISASDAGERSWESDQFKNSVFTRFLLQGLRQNRGAVKDAFEYARPLVRQQVKREKGADVEQNPQVTPDRREWNMSLAGPDR